jgi:hypothetical protein
VSFEGLTRLHRCVAVIARQKHVRAGIAESGFGVMVMQVEIRPRRIRDPYPIALSGTVQEPVKMSVAIV